MCELPLSPFTPAKCVCEMLQRAAAAARLSDATAAAASLFVHSGTSELQSTESVAYSPPRRADLQSGWSV